MEENLKSVNTWTWIIIIIVVVLLLSWMSREPFSQSGMTLSDDYCRNLAYADYDNPNRDQVNYMDRICGKLRRHVIDPETGNYLTYNGKLI